MSEDIEYYRDRALVERSRAKTAPSPQIAAVHDQLASLYEALTSEGQEGSDAAPSPWPQPHTPQQAQAGAS
jgi:hypothetical protein